MSKPPVFGEGEDAWSIGSEVTARWWAERGKRLVELEADGIVIGLSSGGPEGWTATLSFGPAFDALVSQPQTFNPSQISRRQL